MSPGPPTLFGLFVSLGTEKVCDTGNLVQSVRHAPTRLQRMRALPSRRGLGRGGTVRVLLLRRVQAVEGGQRQVFR